MTGGSWTRVWTAPGERLLVEAQTAGDHVRHRFRSNEPGDGAVVVVRREGRVLFAHHDRPVVDRLLLELPRGQADVEDAGPLATARRELAEETGYVASSGVDLGRVWPDSGLSGDGVHVVLVEAASDPDPNGPAPELEVVEWLDDSEIRQAVADGRLRDAISLAALALVAAHDRSDP